MINYNSIPILDYVKIVEFISHIANFCVLKNFRACKMI